jgi:hypothetical protein
MFVIVARGVTAKTVNGTKIKQPLVGSPPARAIMVCTIRKASQYVYVLVAEAFS